MTRAKSMFLRWKISDYNKEDVFEKPKPSIFHG